MNCFLQTGITYLLLQWLTTGLVLRRWYFPQVESIYTLKETIFTMSFNVMVNFFFHDASVWSFWVWLHILTFFTLLLCQIMRTPDRSGEVIKSNSKNVMHHRYFFIYYRLLKIHYDNHVRVRSSINVHLFPSLSISLSVCLSY